ncbi:DUF6880 family protein [Candidatus Tisiphia endosymbiont of Beris chalybata]|uniref:DUF6880 family protein n=1 Tax=Candidatus Tisiphia endosymbiont of Beris chalybata TaxID=3066262 RepID=UPI00312CABCA
MFTKEQLINIGAEKLAEIILSLHKNRPDLQKQLEIIFAGFDSDPKKIISMIKKEIASLKRSSRFVDYYESDALADQVNQVRIHIMEDLLPKSPDQAIELLLNFLDIHQNTLNRVDDSNGTVGDAFQQACADLGKAYEHTTNTLDDVVNLVYDRFMNNDYAVYDNIIWHFKDVLKDNGLSLLKQKLEKSVNQKNTTTIKIGLEQIADCQNDVDAYIEACSFTGKPHAHDHLEIAKRLIKHWRGIEAIEWLDSIDLPVAHSWYQDKQALKIQALDLCGNYKAAQAERLNWFETTLSPKVYSEILKHAEVDFIESFQKTAIQKALDFPNPHIALIFLKEIQEFEQAAKLVLLKIDVLDGSNYYTLRPIADILCKVDPLASTLLYRKMIEPVLVGAKSKYYNYAAKDLATCHNLSSQITDWHKYQNHQLYFEEISKQHKRKTSFWPEYASALNKQIAKDAKIASKNND